MKTRRLIALVALIAGGAGGACNLDKLLEPGDPVAPAGATAAILAFTTQPSDARAGAPVLVRVTARDSAGRRVAQYDSTITITLAGNPNGATLYGKKDVAAVGGVAEFRDLSLDKVGTGYTLSASSVDLSAVTSTGFAISPGTPTTLTFTTQPTDAQPNSAIQPPVQVAAADSFGNPATNFTGTITMQLGHDGSLTQPARLSGTMQVSASGGVATFPNLRVDQIGNGYTLKAGFGSATPVEESAPFDVAPGLPPTGSMTAKTSTTGTSQDPDGYTVAVDGGAGQAIPTNFPSGVTFTGLTAGDHSVELSGVAQNCVVGGSNPRTVTVTAGNTVTTTFNVTCSTPPPTTGDLNVTTTTSGAAADLDPDGYTVSVDGSNRSIGVNQTVPFTGLSAGNHTVALSGIASNCSLSGQSSRTVNVPAGSAAQETFSLSCAPLPPPPPTTGDLTVSTGTSGDNLDPDGYTVTVDGGNSRAIGINSNVTYTGVAVGDHTVQLNGVAQNCAVGGSNPRTVTVTAGGTQTSFAVTCTAPPPPPTNHAPSVDAGPDVNLAIGLLSYTLNASFSDQDHDAPWSYTIDWGDGRSDSGNTGSEGSISRSHTYSLGLDLIRTFTVRVSVTDSHGATGSDEVRVTVAL